MNEIEKELRKYALDQAIKSMSPSRPKEIVNAAEIFLDFINNKKEDTDA